MDKFTKFLTQNYNAVVTRIKIISKLDIAERRVPQDGGSTFSFDKKKWIYVFQSYLLRIMNVL